MSLLLDTGILLRAFDKRSPHRTDILRRIRASLETDERVVVTVQNLAEFWNVSTRPKEHNGYGLAHEVVARRVRIIESFAEVLVETPVSFVIWKRLVEELFVTGVQVHDARLVAVMRDSGIECILTLNPHDFRRYPDLKVIEPTA
jgi:predicted nucleic acid-binding protein